LAGARSSVGSGATLRASSSAPARSRSLAGVAGAG
jgi:hypothetical protein